MLASVTLRGVGLDRFGQSFDLGPQGFDLSLQPGAVTRLITGLVIVLAQLTDGIDNFLDAPPECELLPSLLAPPLGPRLVCEIRHVRAGEQEAFPEPARILVGLSPAQVDVSVHGFSSGSGFKAARRAARAM